MYVAMTTVPPIPLPSSKDGSGTGPYIGGPATVECGSTGNKLLKVSNNTYLHLQLLKTYQSHNPNDLFKS